MKCLPFLRSRLSRAHLWAVLALWAIATALTLLALLTGLDHPRNELPALFAATAGTVLGPMTGAIARHFQPCCLHFSLSLLPACGGALAAAAVLQLLIPPAHFLLRALRLTAWALGLLAWLAGGLIALVGHALS
jgi:hypothetical protein